LDASAFVKYNPNELMQAATEFRLSMMCTETEGSHFKEYCKSTNKIFRKVIFLKLLGNDKFITSGNWFNGGE
jgi:hypothetical protein